MRLIGLILALTVGCSVDVTYPVGLACEEGVCPTGQSCVSRVCVVGPGDAGATAIDASVSTRVCGGSAALSSDFASAESSWIFDSSSSAIVGNGRFELDAGGSNSSYGSTSPRLDLIDSHFFVEMSPSPTGVTTFGIRGDRGGSLTIRHDQGVLSFGFNVDADDDEATVLAYSSIEHRFVGFRERDGKVYFQTSADGVDFTTRRTIDTPNYISRFQGLFAIEGMGAHATFDNLNTTTNGDSGTHPFCSATAFSDDFNIDGPLSVDRWSQFGTCSTVELANGEVRFVSPMDQFCVIVATNLHDLRDSQFVLELGSLFSGYFKYALTSRGSEFVVERFDAELRVSECPAGGQCGPPVVAAYAGQRYWRFRGTADGGLAFSFSADGDLYTTMTTVNSIDLTSIIARFHGSAGSENRVNAFN